MLPDYDRNILRDDRTGLSQKYIYFLGIALILLLLFLKWLYPREQVSHLICFVVLGVVFYGEIHSILLRIKTIGKGCFEVTVGDIDEIKNPKLGRVDSAEDKAKAIINDYYLKNSNLMYDVKITFSNRRYNFDGLYFKNDKAYFLEIVQGLISNRYKERVFSLLRALDMYADDRDRDSVLEIVLFGDNSAKNKRFLNNAFKSEITNGKFIITVINDEDMKKIETDYQNGT